MKNLLTITMKIKDNCYVTGKFRGATHWDCNINLRLTKRVPVTFHNLRGYDSHLIFRKYNKFRVKIETYMAFFLSKNLVFIDSLQFMNSSLDKLVKYFSHNDFKYLTEEFGSKNLQLLKQEGAYPYEYINSFKRFNEKKLPDKKCFNRSLKNGRTGDDGKKLDGHINHEKYLTCEKICYFGHRKYGWLSRSLFEKRCSVIGFF